MRTEALPPRSNLFALVVLWLTLARLGAAQNLETPGAEPSQDPRVLFTPEQELSRWEDLRIIGMGNQLFLQSRGTERTHLFTDKTNCLAGAHFLNRNSVYVWSCSKGAFVADLKGTIRYKLPKFYYYDIAPNKMGTRFAVFERGRSFWHELNDRSYDKLRLLVYSTQDGKKLFEHKWSEAKYEDASQEQIELSDDGSTLLFHRPTGTTTFSIPAPRPR